MSAGTRGGGPPRRIGAEVELLALSAATRRPLPLHAVRAHGPAAPALLPLLRTVAAREGWREEPTPHGAPRFRVRGGGVLSLEPGGQLELSSTPCPSVGALLVQLAASLAPLSSAARDLGVRLVAAGIDPHNTLEDAPLLLGGERYARMDRYFARLGVAGARMMRQTASLQINLDWSPDARGRALQWRVLNAAAPLLIAIFANSPVYAGRETGHLSFRALTWRSVDPARTGLFSGVEMEREYRCFAMDAPMMLRPLEDGRYRTAREWRSDGKLSDASWAEHLSTLFPEVRPRAYLEVRSIDALDPVWHAAPLALLAGLVYCRESLEAAAELLGPPEPAWLTRAATHGVHDPLLAARAEALWRISLAGCEALGPGMVESHVLERAREFARRYTFHGRSPADDLPPVHASPALPLVPHPR